MHSRHQLLRRRTCWQLCSRRLHRRNEEPVVVINLARPRAFHAFDEHLDIAVRHTYRLHDVANHTNGINILGSRLIHGCVVLRCKEDSPIAAERLFQRSNAGFTSDYKGRHHVREDDHLADGHHGEFALSAVEDVAFVVCHRPPD